MTTPTAQQAPFPFLALSVLGACVFVNISVEMLPMGLVLPMSRDLGVSESAIGMLVTVFAFTVVASSTLLIALTRRVPRHVLVVGVLVVFGLTCLASALVTDYAAIVVVRIIAGLAHGVFWTVVGAYAAYLVPKEQLGRAVGITSAGGSLAFVLGLPLSTLLGQWVGWRVSFAVFGIACLAAAVAVWRLLPPVQHLAVQPATETGAIALPQERAAAGASKSAVVVAILCTTFAMTGQYAFYTFVTPFLVEHVGLPEVWLSPALLCYGVMGALAVVIISVWLGKRPFGAAVACMLAILATMLVLGAPTSLPVAFGAVLVWGLAFGALPPLLQTRLLQASPERWLQQATAWYTTGFNTGIGGGALLGALVLEHQGVDALPRVLFVGVGLALTLLLVDRAGRSLRR